MSSQMISGSLKANSSNRPPDKSLAPRRRHRVEGMRHLPHAMFESGARLDIRGIAVAAAHEDILHAQAVDQARAPRATRERASCILITSAKVEQLIEHLVIRIANELGALRARRALEMKGPSTCTPAICLMSPAADSAPRATHRRFPRSAPSPSSATAKSCRQLRGNRRWRGKLPDVASIVSRPSAPWMCRSIKPGAR